jgi:hypothetical protein
MSQETEQIIALVPWVAFVVAVLVFALIDVRDRLRNRRAHQPARAAQQRSHVPLDRTG